MKRIRKYFDMGKPEKSMIEVPKLEKEDIRFFIKWDGISSLLLLPLLGVEALFYFVGGLLMYPLYIIAYCKDDDDDSGDEFDEEHDESDGNEEQKEE